MEFQGDYFYKAKGASLHGAKIMLLFDELTAGSVAWGSDPKTYGEAYRQQNLDIAIEKLASMGIREASIRIDELLYQEPYDQNLMDLVIARAIDDALKAV